MIVGVTPLVALLASFVAASPAAADTPMKVAVWAYPIAPVWLAATGAMTQRQPELYAPFGITWAWRDGVDLSAELSASTQSVWYGVGSAVDILVIGLAGGPSFRTRSSAPLSGFFVQPKLHVSSYFSRHFYYDGRVSRFVRSSRYGVEILMGADVGFQWIVGRAYLALAVGASSGACIGVCAHNWDAIPYAWLRNVPGLLPTAGLAHPAFGLNLHLLRAGATF